jgi:hypothetical protein
VLGRGLEQLEVHGPRGLRAAGHRRHDHGRLEAGAEQVDSEVDLAEVAARQRPVAQPHLVEPRRAAVDGVGRGGGIEVLGLAGRADGVGVHHPAYRSAPPCGRRARNRPSGPGA